MRRRNPDWVAYADLLVLVALGMLAALSVGLTGVGVQARWLALLRTGLAGLFLLFGPGYALVAVLFVSDEDFSVLERTVFSVGASFALVALVGVALDQLPQGVTTGTVVASQLALVVVLTVAAALRRRRAEVWTVGYRDLFVRAWRGRNAVGGGNRPLQAALVVAALLTVGVTAYAATQPLPSERYTELYVVGPEGTVEEVPETVAPGGSVNMTVGVSGHEHETSSMGLQAQVSLPEGERDVVWTDSMSVSHEETVERPISVQMPAVEAGSRLRIEVLLFEGSTPGSPVTPDEAYRSVHTWLTVEETPSDALTENINQTGE